MKKRKRRHLRSSLRPLILAVIGLGAIFAAYRVYENTKNSERDAAQAVLHQKVSSILDVYGSYRSSIEAISRPEGMSEERFEMLKSRALDESSIEMVKAIPDDLYITDVMVEKLEAVPEPGNDWGKLMLALSSTPAGFAELAVDEEQALPFALDYSAKPAQADSNLNLSEDLTSIPVLYSWDERWGNAPYKSVHIADGGSLPVVLSMAGSFMLQDPALSPLRFAGENNTENTENTEHAQNADNTEDPVKDALAAYSIHADRVNADSEAIMDLLYSRVPVIIEMDAKYSGEPHYVLLTGISNQKIRMNDPFSVQASEKEWEISELLPLIRKAWSLSLSPQNSYSAENHPGETDHSESPDQPEVLESDNEQPDAENGENNPDNQEQPVQEENPEAGSDEPEAAENQSQDFGTSAEGSE